MKKKTIFTLLAVLLVAAALAALWYFGYKKPANAAANENLKSVTVNIVHTDGTENTRTFTTERAYLSELLEDEGLLVAEDQGYGLTILSLDGEEALVENNASWVFNVNGEMGTSSVDATPLADGDIYDFSILTW